MSVLRLAIEAGNENIELTQEVLNGNYRIGKQPTRLRLRLTRLVEDATIQVLIEPYKKF